jgi:hypothetical protein
VGGGVWGEDGDDDDDDGVVCALCGVCAVRAVCAFLPCTPPQKSITKTSKNHQQHQQPDQTNDNQQHQTKNKERLVRYALSGQAPLVGMTHDVDCQPSYLVTGGLVFAPLSLPCLEAVYGARKWRSLSPVAVLAAFTAQRASPTQEAVILVQVVVGCSEVLCCVVLCVVCLGSVCLGKPKIEP